MQGVSISTVKDSIMRVEEQNALVNDEMVNFRIAEMVLALMDKNEAALKGALSATTIRTDSRGARRMVVDHKTRMAAITEQRLLIEGSRPKVPGVVLQQQFNNGQPGGGFIAGRSFEDQVRMLRARRGLASEEASEEAVYADSTDTTSLEDEVLQETGIDLEDEDEDEGATEKPGA